MRDIELSEDTSDFVFVDGEPQFVSGCDQVGQSVRVTLLTFQSEWFLDLTYGTPWYTRVLGQRFSAGQIAITVSDAILALPGVASIENITAQKTDERSATVVADVLTVEGARVRAEAGV